MAQYKIYEGNIERLEQKLTRIQNKCNKFGCEFHYARVGEEYKEFVDDNNIKFFRRFIVVEAEGTARINGWEFVGTVEHMVPQNIIRNTTTLVVPERYLHTECICEHCNIQRARKDTYLVHNVNTDEFKQVGSSCLCDFTGGLSAEDAASYLSFFDELIEGEAPYTTVSNEQYYTLEEVVATAIVAINQCGYVKSDPYMGDDQTKVRVNKYINNTAKDRPANFSELYSAAKPEAATVIDYYKSLEIKDNNEYLQNLKAFALNGFVAPRDFGYVVSMVPTYRREMERIEINNRREAARKAEADASEYFGTVGDRVELIFKEAVLVTSFETAYGTSYIYKFIDDEGRVFIWSTGNSVYTGLQIKVKGTIKAHREYRGVKQTELTRCKVTYPEMDAVADKLRADARALGFPETKMYDLDWMIEGIYRGEDTPEKILERVRNYVEKHRETA